MLLKISGKNQELFDHFLTSIMNLACVAAMGGNIPNKDEIQTPRERGRYWFHEKENGSNRFHLYPMSNDYWANVKEEGENFMVVEFRYRYDREGSAFADALTQLLAVRFRDNATIIS